jgi:hypothetical protein
MSVLAKIPTEVSTCFVMKIERIEISRIFVVEIEDSKFEN